MIAVSRWGGQGRGCPSGGPGKVAAGSSISRSLKKMGVGLIQMGVTRQKRDTFSMLLLHCKNESLIFISIKGAWRVGP